MVRSNTLIPVLAFMLAGGWPTVVVAGEVLESDFLRLSVEAGATYAFQAVEKATGIMLLAQEQTRFTIGETAWSVAGATRPVRTADSLQLALVLAGTSEAATVTFTFTQPDILRVELAHDGATATRIREQFADQGEHVYGLFEYPFAGAIDNRGLDRDLIGYSSAAGTNYANARAPFYFTTRRYGLYVESDALGHYNVARNGHTSFWFDGPQLTYYLLYGNPPQVFEAYNDIAGGSYMPPDWALGTIWWRDDHHQGRGSLPNAQARVLEDARQLQRHAIPASAMWIDRPYTTGSWGWGGLDAAHDRIVFDDEGNPGGDGFPDPAGMVAEVNTRGMQLMLWIANRHANEMLAEAKARGYLFAGWEDKSNPAIDLSNADAYGWFQDRLASLFDIGIRGYKIDRGHEGEMPTWAENRNVVLCHEMAAGSMGLTPDGPNEAFIFARNVFDKSRRHCGVWNGDTRTDWTGLQVSVKNALRCASMNFPLWTSDTGGYYSTAPTKELFARWLGFSAYTPVMETLQGPGRTIWDDYDQDLIDIARAHARTHHELIPYVRSCIYRATRTGLPVMRPMVFEFPDDANVTDMWDQYLYGDALLVAPILEAGATSRSVYLPPGGPTWLDDNDKLTVHTAGQTLTVNAGLGGIPVLLRAGGIVVRGDILQANQQGDDWAGEPWTGPWLTIEAFVTDTQQDTTFDYFAGFDGGIPVVRPISLSRTAGAIALVFGDLGVGNAIHCRLFLDEPTSTAFAGGLLHVYMNGMLADRAVRYDASRRLIEWTLSTTPGDLDADDDVDADDLDLFSRLRRRPRYALRRRLPAAAR